MPREEIRLDALEQSMIGAGGDCNVLKVCEDEKESKCDEYQTGLCSGGKGACSGDLYCATLVCSGRYSF